MRKISAFALIATLGCSSTFGAIDLKESKFTQVVNDVQVISTSDNSKHTASVDGLFKMPDVLRTGPGSRAELVAADNTITRVGANTIFSFDAANRSIHLEQGSLLFNSPKGKGGGSIHTAAATAAVLGTTIIVVTTPNGGFKVLTLEGVAEVKFLSGLHQQVHAGQLIFVLPGGLPGPTMSFRLDQQVAGSKLVMGFAKPLASLPRVNAQITAQNKQIASGKATDTGKLVGNSASATGVQVINVISEINASPNLLTDLSGGGGTNPPAGNGLPPGFVIPPGLTFNGTGFVTPDGFTFTSPSGTPIVLAASPAAATLGTGNDLSLTSPTLDPNHVFPQTVLVQLPGGSLDDLHSFTGLSARNLTINTPTIDLSPYSDLSQFIFLASQNLTIANNVNTGPRTAFGGTIGFGATTLAINPGVTVTSDSSELILAALNPIAFSQVGVVNSGNVKLDSGSSISLTDSTINSGGRVTIGGADGASGPLSLASSSMPAAGQISGAGGISLNAFGGMTVGVNLASSAGNITLDNSSGTTTINNGAQISAAGVVSLNSPGGINVTGASLQGGSVSLQSDNGLTLSGANVNATSGTLQIFNFGFNPLVVNTGSQLNGSSINIQASGAMMFDSSTIGSPMVVSGTGIALQSGSAISLNQTAVVADSINISSSGALSLTQTAPGGGFIMGGQSVFLSSGNGMTIGETVSASLTGGNLTLENNFGALHLSPLASLSGNFIEIDSPNGTIQADPGVTIQGNSGVALQAKSGINFGGNITANPSSGNISLDSGTGDLNLNPGAHLTAASVNLTSLGNILTDGNSVIQGNLGVGIHAGTSLSIGGNISTTEGGSIVLQNDAGPLTINDAVTLTADSIVATSAGTIQTGSSTLLQGVTQVQLSSVGGMNLSGSLVVTGSSSAINVLNSSGLLNVNNGSNPNAQFSASTITFNSPDGVLIDTPGHVSAGSFNVSVANTPGSVAQIKNADLSNVGNMAIAGYTIVVSDVALPSSGNTVFSPGLHTFAPNPNTRAQPVSGDLNFFEGVTYQGQPANTAGVGFAVR